MINHIIATHKFTRNIPPPTTPKRYDPNEPPFTPSDFVNDMDERMNYKLIIIPK